MKWILLLCLTGCATTIPCKPISVTGPANVKNCCLIGTADDFKICCERKEKSVDDELAEINKIEDQMKRLAAKAEMAKRRQNPVD